MSDRSPVNPNSFFEQSRLEAIAFPNEDGEDYIDANNLVAVELPNTRFRTGFANVINPSPRPPLLEADYINAGSDNDDEYDNRDGFVDDGVGDTGGTSPAGLISNWASESSQPSAARANVGRGPSSPARAVTFSVAQSPPSGVKPAIANVVNAFSREDFASHKARQEREGNRNSHPKVALWEKRKQVARMLLGNALHKKDVERFAVAFIPETDAKKFEIYTTGVDVGGRVLLKASSPADTLTALKWYVEKFCKMDMYSAKQQGLPDMLPQIEGGLECVLLSSPEGDTKWTQSIRRPAAAPAPVASWGADQAPTSDSTAAAAVVAAAPPRSQSETVADQQRATMYSRREAAIATIIEEGSVDDNDDGTEDEYDDDDGTFKRNLSGRGGNAALTDTSAAAAAPSVNRFQRTGVDQFGAISGSGIRATSRLGSDEAYGDGAVYRRARRFSKLDHNVTADNLEDQLQMLVRAPSFHAPEDGNLTSKSSSDVGDVGVLPQSTEIPTSPPTPPPVVPTPPPTPPPVIPMPVPVAPTPPPLPLELNAPAMVAQQQAAVAQAAMAREIAELAQQREALVGGLANLQSQIQQDWDVLRQQQANLHATAEASRAQLEVERTRLEQEVGDRRKRATELADRVTSLTTARQHEEQAIAREAERQRVAVSELEQAKTKREQLHSTTEIMLAQKGTEAELLMQQERSRIQLLAAQQVQVQAQLDATRSEHNQIKAGTSDLLREQTAEHQRLLQLQAALRDASKLSVTEQHSVVTNLRGALDQHKQQAVEANSALRAGEEMIRRERAKQAEELSMLESDREALLSQNRAQQDIRRQLLEDAQRLDQDEVNIRAQERKILDERERVNLAYAGLHEEQISLRTDQQELAHAQKGMLRMQAEAVQEAENNRAKLILKQKEAMLTERKLQLDNEAGALEAQDAVLAEQRMRMVDQANHHRQLDGEAMVAQKAAEEIARAQHMHDVNNILNAASSSTPSGGIAAFSRRDLMPVLDQTPFDEEQRNRFAAFAASPRQVLPPTPQMVQPNWLSAQIPTTADAGPAVMESPTVIRRKVRRPKKKVRPPQGKPQGKQYVPRAINNDRDLMAFGVEMDRLLEASTYKAMFDYEAEANDELSFKKGDTILLLEKTEKFWRNDPNWLKGICKGVSGYFPTNRVQALNVVLAMADPAAHDPAEGFLEKNLSKKGWSPKKDPTVQDPAANFLAKNLSKKGDSPAKKGVEIAVQTTPPPVDVTTMTGDEIALAKAREHLDAQEAVIKVGHAARRVSEAVLVETEKLEAIEAQNPGLRSVISVPRLNFESGSDSEGYSGASSNGDRRSNRSRRGSGNDGSDVDRRGSLDRRGSSASLRSQSKKGDRFQWMGATVGSDSADGSDGDDGNGGDGHRKFSGEPDADSDSARVTGTELAMLDQQRRLDEVARMQSNQMVDKVCNDFLKWKKQQRHAKLELIKGQDATLSENADCWRYLCFHTAQHPAFEAIILLVVLANIVTLAMYDPLQDDETGQNLFLNYCEIVFLGVYWLELIFRVSAYGFLWPVKRLHRSYLQDGWNWLDMLVVITGTIDAIAYLLELDAFVSLSALRAFRVLRVVKMVQILPTLKAVVDTMAYTFTPLSAVLMMTLLILLIHVMIGLAFYMDVLDRACYYQDTGVQVDVRPCGNASGAFHCGDGQVCYEKLALPSTFQPMESVFNGTLSFNNAGLGMFTVYSVMTKEGWADLMYAMDDALGSSYNWIFFVSCIILSSFVMLNVIRGVLAGAYTKRAAFVQRALTMRRADAAERDDDSEADDGLDLAGLHGQTSPGLAFVEQIDAQMARKGISAMVQPSSQGSPAKAKHAALRRRDSVMHQNKPGLVSSANNSENSNTEDGRPNHFRIGNSQFRIPAHIARYNNPHVMQVVKSYSFSAIIIAAIVANAVFLGLDKHPQSQAWENMLRLANFFFVGIFVLEFLVKLWGYGVQGYFWRKLNQLDFVIVAASLTEIVMVEGYDMRSVAVLSSFKAFRMLRLFKLMTYWQLFREFVIGFIRAFRSAISFFAILLLYVVVVALFGKELFGGLLWSRTNFDNFGAAMISSFQLVTVEGYDRMYTEGVMAAGGPDGIGATAGMFYMFATIFGDWILLSVLLAMVVDTLVQQSHIKQPEVLNKQDVIDGKFLDGSEEDKSMVSFYAFGCLSPRSPIRKAAHGLMWSDAFIAFILLSILASCVMLAVEDYADPANPRNDLLIYFDLGFTAVFTFEMLVKWVALGVMIHPRSYFRSGWNWLDFIVVVTSILSIWFHFQDSDDYSDLAVLRVLRALRAIRAVRMVEQFGNLKKAARTILASLSKIGGLVIIGAVLFYCFAVVGTALFKGQFQYCTHPGFNTAGACHLANQTLYGVNTTLLPAEHREGMPGGEIEWKTHYLNFDNVGDSYVTLLSLIGMEDWTVVYLHSADANGINMGPNQDANQPAIVFFVIFIVVICFFFTSCLLAFVTVMYRTQADELYLKAGMTKLQVKCLRFALNVKLRKDPHEGRRHWGVFQLVQARSFEAVVLAAVLLNTIALLLEHSNMSDDFALGLWYANMAFLCIFAVEFLLKILALGVYEYFIDGWNDVDFAVLVVGVIEVALLGASFVTGFRIIRIVRLGKFLHRGRIHLLLHAFWESMQSAAWIFLLVVLVFFVYAVIGMQLFARLPMIPGSSITPYNNFRDLPNAFLALFRVCTGEKFQRMMEDSYLAPPLCDLNAVGGSTSCGSGLAGVFYLSFVLLVAVLLISLFVAIFIENFDSVNEDPAVITPLHLAEFVGRWKEQDPKATGKVHHRQLGLILRQLPPPLGLGDKAPLAFEDKLLSQLPVGLDGDGKVKFRATLVALVRARCHLWQHLELHDLYALMAFAAPNASIANLADACTEADGGTVITMRSLYTVRRLQAIFRRSRNRKALRKELAVLEERIKELQVAHDLATASWGMNPGPEAFAARDVARKNISRIQEGANAMRRRLTPHLALADIIARVQSDFTRSQLFGKGSTPGLAANGAILPPRVAMWQPPVSRLRSPHPSSMGSPPHHMDPRHLSRPPPPGYRPPPGPQSPAILNPVIERTIRNPAFAPGSPGLQRRGPMPMSPHMSPRPGRFASMAAMQRNAQHQIMGNPNSPYMDVRVRPPAQDALPPSQQWRKLLSSGQVQPNQIYRGQPPPMLLRAPMQQGGFPPRMPRRPDNQFALQGIAANQHMNTFGMPMSPVTRH